MRWQKKINVDSAGGSSAHAVPESTFEDLGSMAQAEFRLRLGKWSKEVLGIMKDSLFTAVLLISFRVHRVSNEIFEACNRFNMKRLTTTHSLMGGRRGLIYKLSTGLSSELLSGYEELLTPGKWTQVITGNCDEHDFHNITLLVVGLTLNEAAGFYRRTHLPLSRCASSHSKDI